MRFRRFVVNGESMSPTLQPGDFVVGRSDSAVAAGDIVAFEHPSQPDFWLIKRVVALAGTVDLDSGTLEDRPYEDRFRDPLVESGRFEMPPGTMFVLSDNRTSTRADSRTFGPIPSAGAYRICFRYWPRPALF